MPKDVRSRCVCIDSVFSRGRLHITFVLQVYKILQPLSICLSYQSTLDTVDELCVDYDADVRNWRDREYKI